MSGNSSVGSRRTRDHHYVKPIVFSTHLLLTQKSLTVVLADPTNETPAHLQLRATELTMTLREIEGYRHGGIND